MEVENCSICQDPLTEGLHETPCGHVFHRQCLSTWIESGGTFCPLCKGPDMVKEHERYQALMQRYSTRFTEAANCLNAERARFTKALGLVSRLMPAERERHDDRIREDSTKATNAINNIQANIDEALGITANVEAIDPGTMIERQNRLRDIEQNVKEQYRTFQQISGRYMTIGRPNLLDIMNNN